MTPYELLQLKKDEFDDANKMVKYRETMKHIFKLQGTKDNDLRVNLENKIYGLTEKEIKYHNNLNNNNIPFDNEEQEINNINDEQEDIDININDINQEEEKKDNQYIWTSSDYKTQRETFKSLKQLLHEICTKVHPKFRQAMLGWTIPNITYDDWLHSNVLDVVYTKKDETQLKYIFIPFFICGRCVDDVVKTTAGISNEEAPNEYYGLTNYDYYPSEGESYHRYVWIYIILFRIYIILILFYFVFIIF